MKPTVGRIVHYADFGATRAAIITKVVCRLVEGENFGYENGYDVWLCVISTTGMSFKELVRHSKKPSGGCWSWPAREEGTFTGAGVEIRKGDEFTMTTGGSEAIVLGKAQVGCDQCGAVREIAGACPACRLEMCAECLPRDKHDIGYDCIPCNEQGDGND